MLTKMAYQRKSPVVAKTFVGDMANLMASGGMNFAKNTQANIL